MRSVDFVDLLKKYDLNFITGVPDSIFSHFLLDVVRRDEFRHFTSSNEGEACSLATGYHLATGKIPVIYLQNSGLGNCINPLTSLLDSYIYSIPALLLITWRGRPGRKDEPQHKRMGEVLPDLLALLQIPYLETSGEISQTEKILQETIGNIQKRKSPHALLFDEIVFDKENAQIVSQDFSSQVDKYLSREKILSIIAENLQRQDIIVTTTGKSSRELFEIREKNNQSHEQDFLTVGSMGCSSSIGFGIAIGQPQRKVVVADGDGACLMRLEAMALIGRYKPENLLHIIIDNNSYESTGSQKTLSDTVDFVNIALACQYRKATQTTSYDDFVKVFLQFGIGPELIVIKSSGTARKDLGRPTHSPIDNKHEFMQFLGSTQ